MKWKYENHPSWLRCKIETMERDGYCCLNCKSPVNIDVYHKYPVPGAKPWEVKQKCLVTYCSDCKHLTLKHRHKKPKYLNKTLTE